jgi:hypothetical protein
MEICERWEKLTQLKLEHGTYQKLVLGDVNNYIAINELSEVSKDVYDKLKKEQSYDVFEERDGKFYYANVKAKGRFEFNNLALHKNRSFLIIPKAIYHHFVFGVEPEAYMKINQDIFDYCGGVKIKGNWKFVEHHVEMGSYVKDELQHTLRYYISKAGSKIIKTNLSDNREIQVEAGPWMQTVFINYVEKPFEEYLIHDDFYLQKIRKEIQSLEQVTNQLSLF